MPRRRTCALRDPTPDELQAAIDVVTAAGLLVVDPNAPPESEERDALTARERDVLALLARGLSNKRIGEKLGISEHTVKFHVGSVLGKLDAATRAEAVAVGVRRGYVVL